MFSLAESDSLALRSGLLDMDGVLMLSDGVDEYVVWAPIENEQLDFDNFSR